MTTVKQPTIPDNPFGILTPQIAIKPELFMQYIRNGEMLRNIKEYVLSSETEYIDARTILRILGIETKKKP